MINNKVTVTWVDALLYHPDTQNKIPSTMRTTGTLVSEEGEYIIIEDQSTIKISDGCEYPSGRKPKYFTIPKGFIQKIELAKD